MQPVRALQVDAFTDEPLAGNAAGVIPDATGLSDAQMAAIARELAVSETAFVLESDEADRRLRYVTPTQEVPLCGHATLAAVGHLHEQDAAAVDGPSTVETTAGVLDVDVESDGTVWMDLPDPTVRPVEVEYDCVAEALGIESTPLTELADDLPLAVASAGIAVLVVPVTYLSVLGDVDPDLAALESLCTAVGADGCYPFTFDTLATESALHGRLFAPALGVSEDPATGTASGAVATYLRQHGALEEVPEPFRFEQGHFLDRPGTVFVRTGDRLRVGGRTARSLEGTLRVPPMAEDEIFEV